MSSFENCLYAVIIISLSAFILKILIPKNKCKKAFSVLCAVCLTLSLTRLFPIIGDTFENINISTVINTEETNNTEAPSSAFISMCREYTQRDIEKLIEKEFGVISKSEVTFGDYSISKFEVKNVLIHLSSDTDIITAEKIKSLCESKLCADTEYIFDLESMG